MSPPYCLSLPGRLARTHRAWKNRCGEHCGDRPRRARRPGAALLRRAQPGKQASPRGGPALPARRPHADDPRSRAVPAHVRPRPGSRPHRRGRPRVRRPPRRLHSRALRARRAARAGRGRPGDARARRRGGRTSARGGARPAHVRALRARPRALHELGHRGELFAITAARMLTGREQVLVFEGGYHGGVLYFAHGIAPWNAPYPFVLAPFNDLDGAMRSRSRTSSPPSSSSRCSARAAAFPPSRTSCAASSRPRAMRARSASQTR